MLKTHLHAISGRLFLLLVASACTAFPLSAGAGQLVFFDFEEGADGTVPDLEPESAGDNAGFLMGGSDFSDFVPLTPVTTPSPSSFSLSLNGNGDYVILDQPGPLLAGAEGFTLAAFVNATSLPTSTLFNSVIFIGSGTNGNQARALLQVGNNGQIGVGGRLVDGNNLARYASANGLITTGVWHHIAATVDFSSGNAVVTLYLNGAPVGHSLDTFSGFPSGTSISSSDSLLAHIGANGAATGEFFHGFIDDVRIYDHVLSAEEIAGLLIVTEVPGPSFEDWLDLAFPDSGDRGDPAVSGPLADPFGTGLANLLRYALGFSPGSPHDGPRPVLVNNGAALRFAFDPELPDVDYIVEATTDLADWSEPVILFDSGTGSWPGWEDGFLEIDLPSTEPRMFFRLGVVQK